MNRDERPLGHAVFRPEVPVYLFVVGNKRLDLLTLRQHFSAMRRLNG